MSRLFSIGFVMLDVTATLLSALSGSSALVLMTITVASSLMISMLSATVRSALFPTYFWDQPIEVCSQASVRKTV